MSTLSCTGPVWRHQSQGGWYFLTVDGEAADDIRARSDKGGFGSVRVRAELGGSSWLTSVFAEAGNRAYVLPLKAEVRRKEGVDEGHVVTVRLTFA